MTATTARIATNLGDVHIVLVGTGPPVLLLHGVGSSHAAFAPQLEALADQFTLVAWDAPGYGESADLAAAAPLADYALAAREVLRALGFPSAHLVGASWGGVIATRVALEFPAEVRTLALIGSTVGRAGNARATADIESRVRSLADEGVERWARSRVDRVLGPDAPDELREAVRQTMVSSVRHAGFASAAATLIGTDHRERLAALSLPTLVIAGADDRVTGIPEGEVLAGAVPGARLLVVGNSGHLTNQEQPAVVDAALHELWTSEEEDR